MINIPYVLCLICGLELESLVHLFFRWWVVVNVCQLNFRWLQLQDVEVGDIGSLFDWIDSVKVNTKKKMAVDVVVCTILWISASSRSSSISSGPRLTLSVSKQFEGF
ncbi:hypothetical protein LXL04_035614 [Taraxacum kok-saghyz]